MRGKYFIDNCIIFAFKSMLLNNYTCNSVTVLTGYLAFMQSTLFIYSLILILLFNIYKYMSTINENDTWIRIENTVILSKQKYTSNKL